MTNYVLRPHNGRMNTKEAIYRVQSAYPKIYLACHRRHQNSKTTEHSLSQRDASLLAHLSRDVGFTQNQLAQHLGISKSTLSEALTWLESCGYVKRTASGKDQRAIEVMLTEEGCLAMSSSSVLEAEKLEVLLDSLTSDQRAQAIEGLEILARAALDTKKSKGETE